MGTGLQQQFNPSLKAPNAALGPNATATLRVIGLSRALA